MPIPTLLSTADLAEVLRTSRRAIYSMVARGEIPGIIRLGTRRLLFDKEAIRQWIDAARTQKPGSHR